MMKKCPFCAEEIQDEAMKCRWCGEFLDRPPRRQGGKWYQRTAGVVVALLCVGPLALPLVWLHPRFSIATKVVVSIGVVVLTAAIIVTGYLLIGLYAQMIHQISSLGIG